MKKKLAARAAGGAAARRLFAKAPAHRLRRGAKEGTGEVVSWTGSRQSGNEAKKGGGKG